MWKSSRNLRATLPTGARGRVLALALLVVALLLAWLGVAEPLADLYAAQDQSITERRAFAERMAVVAAELPALRRRAAEGAGSDSGAPLGQDSDALAAAKLQDLVKGYALAAGAALSSVETLPAEPAGPYRRIALRIRFEGTLPVLIDLLLGVEATQQRLLVDELELHGSPLNRADSASSLMATFVVYGFRVGRGA
jgi:hypothetical protein